MLTLNEVKNHPGIKACIKKTEQYLDYLGYTDHGPRHINVVSDRAKSLAKNIGLSEREQELTAIAGYCHDMGNFLQRTDHCYTGAILFSQFFINDYKDSKDVSDILEIMQAIANHDEHKFEIINKIGAILVLADKSDVHRNRVKNKTPENIKKDIHDRVNYSVMDSVFKINKQKKEIILKLTIDTEITGVMEYFEIFNERMIFCRKAAEFLDCHFVLVINNFKLS
ncbi:phosphohydrolase [Candidatus Falkowbacteria bacterium HGW-Falkowbacteria-1]|uniref:Phosphohydrolase n=1 Tax=Candidatus Falkowbacteria bacterium HGW-Falkowbacteria-1 TaxID=2013768 RepID=A0A2N2E9J4_9BACT|nr:MAG: phosphohydrolase [Candidatus Falkowbacteria bacterium HGW-Falkowbacteria-1]